MSQANAPSSQPTPVPARSSLDQGIQGQVLRLTGDFMPTSASSGNSQRRQPVQTTVWVFAGKLPAQGTQWPVAQASQHPQLVQRVGSDAAGKFSVALAPGEYTLFAQYESDLHLNAFAGDNSYASVQVRSGEITAFDLINRDAATF